MKCVICNIELGELCKKYKDYREDKRNDVKTLNTCKFHKNKLKCNHKCDYHYCDLHCCEAGCKRHHPVKKVDLEEGYKDNKIKKSDLYIENKRLAMSNENYKKLFINIISDKGEELNYLKERLEKAEDELRESKKTNEFYSKFVGTILKNDKKTIIKEKPILL